MPRVTIWIRNDDLEKWLAITDRPEFIHKALNPFTPPELLTSITRLAYPMTQLNTEGYAVEKKVLDVKFKGKSIPFKQTNGMVSFDTNGRNVNEFEVVYD